jgi:hypothetical protein
VDQVLDLMGRYTTEELAAQVRSRRLAC